MSKLHSFILAVPIHVAFLLTVLRFLFSNNFPSEQPALAIGRQVAAYNAARAEREGGREGVGRHAVPEL